ncbi:MAG: hypothetical protein ACYC1M_13890 [Armatimonadota bacterium]
MLAKTRVVISVSRTTDTHPAAHSAQYTRHPVPNLFPTVAMRGLLATR